MKSLEETWRWYGPKDPVQLSHVKQAGAAGIVTALHQVPIGEVWTKEDILTRQEQVKNAGLYWSVIESMAIHEDIKTHTGNFQQYIENYKESLVNIGKCGLDILCYNFMPALDWTRTDLNKPCPDGSTALAFDQKEFAAFDLFILKRPGARDNYSQEVLAAAESIFAGLSSDEIAAMTDTCITGLPGNDQRFGLEEFRAAIEKYSDMTAADYRDNVKYFLSQVVPVAAEHGIKMAVHPDDPPFDILGLPRIVSNAADVREYLSLFPHESNGLTFCTGSFGAWPKNNPAEMVREFGDRIYFVHLRNVTNFAQYSFHEDNHLDGDVDMYQVMTALIEVAEKRGGDRPLPFRPDHGHRMIDDLDKKVNPGYSAIGRLRGLAELRGLELGIRSART